MIVTNYLYFKCCLFVCLAHPPLLYKTWPIVEENLPYLMEQSQPKVRQADLKHLALLIGVETKDDHSADNVVKRTI